MCKDEDRPVYEDERPVVDEDVQGWSYWYESLCEEDPSVND